MMNEGSSYNLAEIWQLPSMNGGGGGMVMGLRRPQFGDVNGATNREVSGNDPMSLDHRGVHGGGGNGGGSRKRRDLEDDSSNSNGAVFASNFMKIFFLCSLPLNLYEHKS